ncbi:hypothetical protein [Umezawaea beigongshangensis]|nr:hypothetical protein [Umezawaea beigongshangensis]
MPRTRRIRPGRSGLSRPGWPYSVDEETQAFLTGPAHPGGS